MSDTAVTLASVAPRPPKFEPSVTSVTPTSVTVEWGQADGDGGSPVCGYIVIAAMKTITKSLGAGAKKRRAQQKNNTNSGNNSNSAIDLDLVPAPDIPLNSSIETRAMETIVVPTGFTVVGECVCAVWLFFFLVV